MKEAIGQQFELAFQGRKAKVFVANRNDVVQSYHQWGKFYEAEQLRAHLRLIFHYSTVIDVGANVGNHTIFYALNTSAKKIYPFEPNPTAHFILTKSLSFNEFGSRVDLKYSNFAVGEQTQKVYIAQEVEDNLGATHFTVVRPQPDAREVECRRLDDLAMEGPISLMKVDVEGMEMAVLQGAENLIDTHRPSIAIEVHESHESEFWKWISDHQYHVIDLFHESRHVKNYLIIPRPK